MSSAAADESDSSTERPSLLRAVVVGALTVGAWLLVGRLVAGGQLSATPLGLADIGLPGTVVGIPTVYAAGILLFALLVLFGGGSGGSGYSHHINAGGPG